MPLDLSHVSSSRDISDDDLIGAFATLMTAMRERGIIRTKNVVGDLGERYAVSAYRANPTKTPIALSETNETDVDARNGDGLRFAIKAASTSSSRTSAFHLTKDWPLGEEVFDYLVVVRVDDMLRPTQVYELTWAQFWSSKKWSERQQAWFLPLSKGILDGAQCVFPVSPIP